MKKIKKRISPEYFDAISLGKKNYELRLNEFDIQEGDTLILQEHNPKTREFTGREIEKKVTREAVKRIYKKYYFIATILAFIFATNFVQRLFFENMIFRRIVEYLRHKRMLKKNIPQ